MTQIFISYSRKDLAFVERLAKDLKSTGLDIWYDLSGLNAGSRWGIEIQKAISHSKYFIAVLSPNSAKSEWVEREFLYASKHRLKVIPLVYKFCDLPMWSLNLHFIDVQGENYLLHLPDLLKALGKKPGKVKNISSRRIKRWWLAGVISILTLGLMLIFGIPLLVKMTAKTYVVTSLSDNGPGSLRQAILDAKKGDKITFNTQVFPPDDPATITLIDALPDISQGNLTIDGSNAGVILDGTNLGDIPNILFLDDISLTVDGGQNLIVNGSFDNGLNHWRGWDERAGVIRSLSGDFHSAPYSFSVMTSPRIGVAITTYDTAEINDLIGLWGTAFSGGDTGIIHVTSGLVEFRFWRKGGPLRVIINTFNADGTDQFILDQGFEQTFNWSEGVVRITLPTGIVGIQMLIMHMPLENADGISITSNDNMIRGLQIINFPSCSIMLHRSSSQNTIGGDRQVGAGPLGQGNLFGGQGNRGLCLGSETSHNNIVGNYIGTNLEGTEASGLNTFGIWLAGIDNRIENNLISGIGYLGIWMGFSMEPNIQGSSLNHNNLICNNFIGTDASGTKALPNSEGINIGDGSYDNLIGPGNIIAYNTGAGVSIFRHGTIGNAINQNSIYENGVGISLSGGGNIELPAPIISFSPESGAIIGTTCGGCIVEFFSTDNDQGNIYEGQITVGNQGLFTFTKGMPFTGPYLTATATDGDNNTSRFSNPIQVTSAESTPSTP